MPAADTLYITEALPHPQWANTEHLGRDILAVGWVSHYRIAAFDVEDNVL